MSWNSRGPPGPTWRLASLAETPPRSRLSSSHWLRVELRPRCPHRVALLGGSRFWCRRSSLPRCTFKKMRLAEMDAGGPASGSIEVEQKFLFGPGTEEKLLALGATLVGNASFQDQYFDTPDWRLTLADHWLREREGSGWELKCPPQPPEEASMSSPATESRSPQGLTQVPAGRLPLQPLEGANRPHPATQYQEVTCPRDIVARVCGLLGMDLVVEWCDDVARAVEELGLEEFANFVTRRRKYRVGELSVDLDEADFGYAVGEVEAVVRQREDVPEALERIQELGRQLGFDEKTRIPGKMSVYLHKFRPAHYESLVRAGRLRKVGDARATQGEKD